MTDTILDDRGRLVPPADWHKTGGPTLADLLAQALAAKQDGQDYRNQEPQP